MAAAAAAASAVTAASAIVPKENRAATQEEIDGLANLDANILAHRAEMVDLKKVRKMIRHQEQLHTYSLSLMSCINNNIESNNEVSKVKESRF